MILRLTRSLLIGCLLLAISSCEYDSDSTNYHEITPPEATITTNIELSGTNPENVIYIYAPTNLQYTLNTSSGTVVNQDFKLDGRSLTLQNGNIIHIYPSQYDNEIHLLKIKLTLSSGSGSLAEILGKEIQNDEVEFKLKYVKTDNTITINQRVNSKGNLELFWEKPSIDGISVAGYDIYYNEKGRDVLLTTITDGNQTSFADLSYAYSLKTYRMVTRFNSDQVDSWVNFHTVKYTPIVKGDFAVSNKTNSGLLVSWNNPNKFNCKYVLKWNTSTLYNVEKGKSSALATRDQFPLLKPIYYTLYILPETAPFSDYLNYPSVSNSFEDNKFLFENNNYPVVDVRDNTLLTVPLYVYKSLYSYDITDMSFKNKLELNLPDNVYIESVEVAQPTGHVAIHYRSHDSKYKPNIVIYEDKTLKKALSWFPASSFPSFVLTGNDRLFLLENYMNKELKVYDIKTKRLILTHTEPQTEDGFRMTVSHDGKYMYARGGVNHWYRLYEFDGEKLTVVQQFSGRNKYSTFSFHPQNSGQAIVKDKTNGFSIIEIPSMKVIKSIAGDFYAGLSPIDPISGNLIYRDANYATNNQINVLDNTYSKVIFTTTIKPGYSTHIQLMNNYIFQGSHMHMKID